MSALRNTKLPVIVGYISESDVSNLRDLPIEFRKIHQVENPVVSGKYAAFDKDDFYRIVMNKWELLLQTLSDYDFLIYSDIDAIWLRDAGVEVEKIFMNFPNTHVVIQAFGQDESSPSLCMGFVGIRNSVKSLEFLTLAKKTHSRMIVENPRIGDDDIATLIMKEANYPEWLHRLSPVYFPVGNTFNLFVTKPVFPGLSSPVPFIFHLNYVVGLENKRLMLKILSSRNQTWHIESHMSWIWTFKLLLKRIKFRLGSIRKYLK